MIAHDVLPEQPGGPVRVPSWFENLHPKWQVTPAVQAFADWCYEPLRPMLAGSDELLDDAVWLCTQFLHSMMAPTRPYVDGDPACLLAVAQHGMARTVDTAPVDRFRGMWKPSVSLPDHATAAEPSWADCPSALWPGPKLPERSAPEAERACHWAGSVVAGHDPLLTWASEHDPDDPITDGGAVIINWGQGSCLDNLWPDGMSRCGFAFLQWAAMARKRGEIEHGDTWTSGLGCP